MATSRLLFTAQRSCSPSSSSSSYARPNASKKDISLASNPDPNKRIRELALTTPSSGNRNILLTGKVAAQATTVTHTATGPALDVLWSLLVSNFAAKWKFNPSQAQFVIERVIVDCRFFSFLGVAGSLIGSILCFLEGSMMVVESYFRYMGALLHRQDHTSMLLQLLMEGINTFLVGTAMITLGMGLYVMFVGSKRSSNAVGLFSWLKMESVWEAKTRIGHAVVMILQVGMVEKFKRVPLVTGLDLAAFAGALLLSSASIFCLSKLTSASPSQER